MEAQLDFLMVQPIEIQIVPWMDVQMDFQMAQAKEVNKVT